MLADRAMQHVCASRESVLGAPGAARAVLSLGALTRLYLNRISSANYDPYAANLNVSSLRCLVKLGIGWR